MPRLRRRPRDWVLTPRGRPRRLLPEDDRDGLGVSEMDILPPQPEEDADGAKAA